MKKRLITGIILSLALSTVASAGLIVEESAEFVLKNVHVRLQVNLMKEQQNEKVYIFHFHKLFHSYQSLMKSLVRFSKTGSAKHV